MKTNEKRNKILKAVNVMGNKLFNEPFLSCPICGHDFVAHNIYDFNYPYIDIQMLKEYVQPLTFADKNSEYKYYCLTCGSEFEIQDIPKKVFHFERGAYFAGTLEYTVWEMHDHMLFESQSSNDFCHMRDYKFSFPKEDMNLFNPLLKPILKWKTVYENTDEIYDGYGWSIEYSSEGFSINTRGYEAWPIDYKFRIRKIQQLLEKLCKKYVIDYSIEESKERLLL